MSTWVRILVVESWQLYADHNNASRGWTFLPKIYKPRNDLSFFININPKYDQV